MVANRPRPSIRSARNPHPSTSSQKDIQAFPEEAANSLISIAHKVYLATEVKGALDVARKLKPNAKAITDTAEKWYVASEKMATSREALSAAYNDLGEYWNGDAYDLFSEYMKEVDGVADDNSNTLFELGNAVVDLYNDAVNGYNEAVIAIGETLQRAQEIDPDKHSRALFDMLTSFINDISQRKQTLQYNLAIKQGKIAAMSGRIKQLRTPRSFPVGVADKTKWIFDSK